ncbi:glycosyltransferase, partial [Candidatus Peregrinibacteria bacterium]|nr:glycosyltransferase [Candidatus Peregrinibacteria bacterium]
VHDSNYWRAEGDYSWYEEDSAIQNCDAMIFPSQICEERYQTLGKPTKVVWSANLEAWKFYGPWDWYGGIVSQGGHIDPAKTHKGESWRDYTDLYKELESKDKQVFAYSADFKGGIDLKTQPPELDAYYIKLGAILGCFNHMDLIHNMGRHDWSLCGNINGAKVWDYALPNKFFDAMSGCVPVVNFNCPEVGKLIDEYDVGINVESVDELVERWDEHKEKRASVYRNRNELTMERQIHKVIELYNEIY